MEIWFNVKPVTNGSISNVFVFSHFPTVMTNGLALLVCEQCVRLIELRFNLFSISCLVTVDSFIYMYPNVCICSPIPFTFSTSTPEENQNEQRRTNL